MGKEEEAADLGSGTRPRHVLKGDLNPKAGRTFTKNCGKGKIFPEEKILEQRLKGRENGKATGAAAARAPKVRCRLGGGVVWGTLGSQGVKVPKVLYLRLRNPALSRGDPRRTLSKGFTFTWSHLDFRETKREEWGDFREHGKPKGICGIRRGLRTPLRAWGTNDKQTNESTSHARLMLWEIQTRGRSGHSKEGSPEKATFK